MDLISYVKTRFNSDLLKLRLSRCNSIAKKMLPDIITEFWGGPEWENYSSDIGNIFKEYSVSSPYFWTNSD